MKKLILLSAAILLLLSVSHLRAQDLKLTRRYKKLVEVKPLKAEDAVSYAELTFEAVKAGEVFLDKKTTTPAKTVFDLSEEGQEAYIDAYLEEAKANAFADKKVKDILCHSCPKPKASRPLVYDFTRFRKRIVFDVDDKWKAAGNEGRLEYVNIYLQLNNTDDVSFYSFDGISTKYETHHFGDVSRQKSTAFTLNAGIEIAGTGSTTVTQGGSTSDTASSTDGVNTNTFVTGGTNSTSDGFTSGQTSNLGAGLSLSNVLNEAVTIRQRRIALKGSLSERVVRIYSEGAPGYNLNDKIELDVIVKAENVFSFPIFFVDNLFKKDGTAETDLTKLELERSFCRRPEVTSNVMASSTLEFNYRAILASHGLRGEKGTGLLTASEHDDIIYYARSSGSNSVTSSNQPFISANELYYPLMKIANVVTPTDQLWIKYRGNWEELLFLSEEDAQNFIEWLYLTYTDETKPISLGGNVTLAYATNKATAESNSQNQTIRKTFIADKAKLVPFAR